MHNWFQTGSNHHAAKTRSQLAKFLRLLHSHEASLSDESRYVRDCDSDVRRPHSLSCGNLAQTERGKTKTSAAISSQGSWDNNFSRKAPTSRQRTAAPPCRCKRMALKVFEIWDEDHQRSIQMFTYVGKVSLSLE